MPSGLESIHGTTIIAQRASPTAPESFNRSFDSTQSSSDPVKGKQPPVGGPREIPFSLRPDMLVGPQSVGGQRDELFEPESLGIDWSACKEWPNPAACDDRPCSNSQQWDCYVGATQLRKDYARTQQAASGNINYVPAHQLLDWERYRDIYAAELRDIEEKYMDLMRICCQECGIPLPSVETLQTTIPEVKGAMGVIASELQQFSAEAPQDPFPLNFGRVGCEFFFEEGGGVEAGGGPVAVGLPRRFVCNSFAPFDFIKGYSGLAGDFVEAWVKDDPPSPLYKQVVQPVVEPSVVPSVAAENNHLLRQAIEAQLWAVAYIKAFIASYERYQGAEQTRDIAAMLLQAEAMLDFAERALEARRKVVLEVYRWELALFRLFDSAMKGFQERGGIAQVIRENRAEASGAMTAEAQERFRAAGLTESEILAAETWVRELNPSTLEKEIARFQARMVAGQKLQADFTSRSPGLTWPEPPEAGSFFDLKRISRRLVWQAKTALKGVARLHLDFAPAKLPSGLAKALLRRASFSRTHRGSFAKPLEGRAHNSSDMAASWHTGERVLFAWHQRANQVVFTAFDPRGETLINPQEIGTGRWPRLAANGQRTAVAFEGEEGFIVRLHDGQNWSEQVPLNGGDAVIAFAPGGPLYAATSTGLWKMTDGSFEQVRQASYEQPTLAVDGNGTPHVAWHRDGRIIYEGEELSQGERPTIVVAPQGAVHLAYLSDGSVVFRSYEGGEWSQPKEIVAKEKNPSWPTLAFGENHDVRLTYIGEAKHGPPALWLVRLPDEEPILIPSLAGNVTDAWLMLKFSLNDARTRYRRHDMLVTVNDVWIKLFEDTVPEGRYLFRLDPRQIFYSPRRPAPNRISILNWGMNNGNYLISSDYELIIRTTWSEYFGFASSGQEVIDAAHATWRITHDQPDLVVLANNLDLPVEAPIGSVDFPITVANLGEADGQPSRLVMLSGDDRLAMADIPLLKPEEQMIINIRLNGELEKVRFKIEQDIKDFDPDNDVLDLALWKKEDYQTVREQRPDLPTLPTKPEVILVPTPNDVQPPWLVGSLPVGAKPVGKWSWELAPTFNAPRSHTSGEVEGRSLHYFIRAEDRLPLAAGDNLVQYVYLDSEAPPEQILLQLFVEGTKEGQAVYWGGEEDLIRVGGEVAKRLGDLPETGKWVRLRVPVEIFGMKNAWINGLLFGQHGGRIHWGPTTKSISRLDQTEGVMVVSER
ncbi:MAG: hypothetical protein R3268_00800 [Acidiferrobacterales bacterium]|nr:hypothetical protein [Acidiferrobacterales bacterium]